MSSELRDVSPGASPPSRRRDGPGLGSILAVVLLAAGVAAAAFVTLAGTAPDRPVEPATPETTEADPPEPPPRAEVVTTDTLRAGQGLGDLLREQGLEGRAFATALDHIRSVEDPRRLQPGVTVQVTARVPESVSRVSLRLDADRSVRLVAGDGYGWTATLDSVPVTTDTLRVGGVIDNSLWTATLFGDTARLVPNERYEIVTELSNNIFAWQVDFFRDIRPGDAFRVLIEREIRPDGSMRRARVLAAEFFNQDRRLTAVRFDIPDMRPEYYDEEGEATRMAFLRAPLEFGRRTSGFSRRRYHPVLKVYRSHRGIDYGARRGTPVHATGAGVVTRAHWWNGYGRVVEIRHTGAYRTRYAHLSRFARGIRSGVRVEQDQVIGYVGSSGLATGSHVHYEFLVHGQQRNPARVDLPPGDPVPEAHRAEYRAVRDRRLALLRELSLPSTVRLAAEGDAPGGATTN